MNSKLLCIPALAVAIGLFGCGDKSETQQSSSTLRPCSDIAKATDPKEITALKDRCGVGQPHEYTASPKKTW